MTEQFSNFGKTTLSGTISAGATSLVVASAALFPTGGNFRIVIDTEVFLVTAVSGTTFTVTPGYEGTTQASHTSGAAIQLVLTSGLMNMIFARANNEINVTALPAGYGTSLVGDDTTDDSVALNSIITNFVTSMTSAGSTLGFPALLFPPKTYKINSQITSRPWIKMEMLGGATLDYQGLSASGTGFRCHNQDAPISSNSSGNSNAANQGPFINGERGSCYIIGPGSYSSSTTTTSGSLTASATSLSVTNGANLPASGNYYLMLDQEVVQVTGGQGTNSLTIVRSQFGTTAQVHASGISISAQLTNTCLDLGDVSGTAGTGQYDFRDTCIAKTVIRNWSTGIYIRGTNVYFLRFNEGGYIFSCPFSVVTENINGVNSGELDSFRGWIFSGGICGVVANSSGTDMLIEDTSIDYMIGPALLFQNNANYMTWTVQNCHIEHCENGFAVSTISTLNALCLVVRNAVYNSASTISHGDSPRQALFRGKMILDLDGIIIGYSHPWHDATVGLFACDSNVSILNFTNIRFVASGYGQLTAQQLLLNADPFFNQSTSGTALGATTSSGCPDWYIVTSGGFNTITIDNTNPLSAYGSSKSLKFTSTQNGGNYCVLAHTPIRVIPGQQLAATACGYGGTSTGVGNMQMQLIFSCSSGALPSIADGSIFGDSMASLYGDNTDPAYTGGRAWHLKLNTVRVATVPAGYDQAQLQFTFAGLNTGETAWITFIGICSLN